MDCFRHNFLFQNPNDICLHYINNNTQCKEGELILLDVAAEYANYASDLTRTVPVSGSFSPRQKEVYQADSGYRFNYSRWRCK